MRWHPSALDWDAARAAPGAVEARDRAPKLVTAGMVLLAAAAIFEGYRRLNVIPASIHPSALVFAAVVVPAALLLTRTAMAAARRSIRVAVEAAAVGLVAMTVVDVMVNRPWSARALGAYDLVLAAAVLVAAVASGDFSST